MNFDALHRATSKTLAQSTTEFSVERHPTQPNPNPARPIQLTSSMRWWQNDDKGCKHPLCFFCVSVWSESAPDLIKEEIVELRDNFEVLRKAQSLAQLVVGQLLYQSIPIRIGERELLRWELQAPANVGVVDCSLSAETNDSKGIQISHTKQAFRWMAINCHPATGGFPFYKVFATSVLIN